MGRNDPDEDLFIDVEAAESVCTFRGWIKDSQISTDGELTLKFGVYAGDKWEALKVTDIRERVVSIEVTHLRPVRTGDRTHLDKLKEMNGRQSLSEVIDVGDVIDLTDFIPQPFVMSHGK